MHAGRPPPLPSKHCPSLTAKDPDAGAPHAPRHTPVPLSRVSDKGNLWGPRSPGRRPRLLDKRDHVIQRQLRPPRWLRCEDAALKLKNPQRSSAALTTYVPTPCLGPRVKLVPRPGAQTLPTRLFQSRTLHDHVPVLATSANTRSPPGAWRGPRRRPPHPHLRERGDHERGNAAACALAAFRDQTEGNHLKRPKLRP